MASANRPQTLQISKSFTRMEPTPPAESAPRKRASTLQEAGIPAVPEARQIEASLLLDGERHIADIFEKDGNDAQANDEIGGLGPELNLPSSFDELPIEIRSITERFLESLSAKVHPTPLNADKLSELFQEFYERAAGHIATHIATLASKIGRPKKPSLAAGSGKSLAKGRARAGSGAKGVSSDDLFGTGGGEMLTPSEIAERKKARRQLEIQRVGMEEAVERGVCEKVYDKVWKHRSTDDDARDEKLRSRTAALALVGIGLKELHGDQDPAKADVRKTAEEKEDEIYNSLATARDSLQRMDDEQYPLGKLRHLKAAHKSIVETLSQLFPSSSSADEILPTLIYTLITSPPEGFNAVSNLNFIQRFRATTKVDGEAAYCLVNLEAAISFLETVDLSSLRADELPEGPPKSTSRPSTPSADTTTFEPQPASAKTLTPDVTPLTVISADQSGPITSPEPISSRKSPTAAIRPGPPTRNLSSMVQAQADRIEASRDNFLSAADKIYDSINGTLDNSIQFVFGRFKEQAVSGNPQLPKTLEDARKLVSPSVSADDDEALSVSGRSSPANDPLAVGKSDSKMFELLGGRKQLRDQSVDSTRSGGSGKRVAFTDATTPKEKPKEDPLAAASNLFANINPLNRFGMPSFSRFGRAASGGSLPPVQPPLDSNGSRRVATNELVESPSLMTAPGGSEKPTEDDDGLNARESLATLRKLKPPKKRFLEVASAQDLKIGEVDELLKEYRRLAKGIGEALG